MFIQFTASILKSRVNFLYVLGPSSTCNLTLLNNVKKMEDGTHFCGLLRTSELYKENLKQLISEKFVFIDAS